MIYVSICFVFFFKQKTAYEIVSRDWSSDVCSSDLTNLLPFVWNAMMVLSCHDKKFQTSCYCKQAISIEENKQKQNLQNDSYIFRETSANCA